MATRMQQRRGTAAQWTSANPILAAGEIGFETDTTKFKIGDGVNHWADLVYYASAQDLSALIDGAPDLLNTLNELAAAIGDDPDFLTAYATNARVDGVVLSGGQAVTSAFNTANQALLDHASDTTSVHGIDDTSVLVTQTDLTNAITGAVVDQSALAGTGINWNAVTEQFDLDSDIATTMYADSAASTAAAAITKTTLGLGAVDNTDDASKPVSTAQALAISNAKSEAIAAAGQDADDKISTHNLDETNVHGIADTTALATKTYADGAVSTAVAALTKSSVGLGNVDNTSDADKPVSTATQTALDLKAPLASPTFTGTVSGITKSMVGLGNVDNTTDANKPVSTATQTALDLKAPKASPTFTGTVTASDVTISGNLTVSGTTTTVNTTNFTTSDPVIYLGDGNNANTVDLGFVASYNDGTYAHQGLVKDSSDSKWKLFKGVTDEPTTTVNFAQGSLDTLAVGALEATTVTPSSGIVFTDGTQTKEGVPSRTPIIQKTAGYTLSSLTERDSLIEVSSSSGVTITIPTDATLNFPIGTSIDILQTSTGQVTIAAATPATTTVNATPGLKLRTQWSSATLFKRAANTWVVMGDLTA